MVGFEALAMNLETVPHIYTDTPHYLASQPKSLKLDRDFRKALKTKYGIKI